MLEPGQIFARRYRVIKQIAEGGMGAIFLAEHTATERKVALKLLFPHVLSIASARQKFELEAKISARVDSPYIVEILDAGFDESSRSPFLVMEMLEGLTIADHVEQNGPMGPDEAIPLLEQVADGLDGAHGYCESDGSVKPIIHRDLKPENIFMARERSRFEIKILDFGIAKVLGETSNVSQEVRGTPLYMATEQVTAGELSPQTDIWALGLIAHYMLTASAYWRSASQENANMQSLFAEILTLPLDSPSLRLEQLKSSVSLPNGFDAWFSRCVDRKPGNRYRSAGEAIEELARVFKRPPRHRPRPSTRCGPAFAATHAQVAETPKRQSLTAQSLPGMTHDRASSTLSLSSKKGPNRIFVGMGISALLLGAVVWGASSSSSESMSAAAPIVSRAATKPHQAPAKPKVPPPAAIPQPLPHSPRIRVHNAPATAPATAPVPEPAIAQATVAVTPAAVQPPPPKAKPKPKPKAKTSSKRTRPRRPRVSLRKRNSKLPKKTALPAPTRTKESASDAYKLR